MYFVSKRLMISSGESSGELYGALLARELRRRWPEIDIFGIGGARMKDEGVDLIAPISHIIGLTEAVRAFGSARRNLKIAGRALALKKPNILVVIDYPDFNLILAKKAQSLGIPVLYYVSPQVWAWRRRRVSKIAERVNKIALLFPFEVDYYKKAGLPCEFVGHPLDETIAIDKTKDELKKELGLIPDRPVITLLPGSRPSEISRHIPIIREIAAKVHRDIPEFQTVIPLVEGTVISDVLPDYLVVMHGLTKEAIASSEVCAVASGTATLETALLGIPMVVFYMLSPLTYFMAKRLVKVDYVSLVNLLSGKEVVKEFLQKEATADNIYSEMKRIMEDRFYRNRMISHFKELKNLIGGRKTSKRVAAIVGELAGWSSA